MVFGRDKYRIASGTVNPINIRWHQQILFAILIGARKEMRWVVVDRVHIVNLFAFITPYFFGAASENEM